MLHTLLFFTLVLHSCAAFCAYQVCAKAQILRVKNLIFHTSLHSAGTKCWRNREPNVRFGSAINAICGACGTNSCVKNQISICIFHTISNLSGLFYTEYSTTLLSVGKHLHPIDSVAVAHADTKLTKACFDHISVMSRRIAPALNYLCRCPLTHCNILSACSIGNSV